MSATISDETARDILAKAFLDAIPHEQQEQLLVESITRVLTEKEKTNYNNPSGLSTLERVFQEEITKQIRSMVNELLTTDPELKERLRTVALATMSKGLDKFTEVFQSAVTNILEKAISGRAY